MRIVNKQLLVLAALVNIAGNVRVKPKNVCDSGPCLNGGQCIDLSSVGPHGVKRFQCACPEGYKGVTCQKKIHPCATDPCMNGGICRPRGENYRCDCLEGYEGKRCSKLQARKSTCSGHPCGDHGECQMVNDGIVCECDQGYHGVRCQLKRQPVHHEEVKVVKVPEHNTDPGIRDLLFLLVVLLIVFVLIVLCMCMHCCRIYYRRADYKALQRKRKYAGEETESLPSWMDTSNRLCNEFLCCRSRDSDEHLQGSVSGVIVSAKQYEQYLWDKDKCNKGVGACSRRSSYGSIERKYSDGGYVIVDPTDDEAEHGIPAAYYPPGAKGPREPGDDPYVRLMPSFHGSEENSSMNRENSSTILVNERISHGPKTYVRGTGEGGAPKSFARGTRVFRDPRASSRPRARRNQQRPPRGGVDESDDEYESSENYSEGGSSYAEGSSSQRSVEQHRQDHKYYSDSTVNNGSRSFSQVRNPSTRRPRTSRRQINRSNTPVVRSSSKSAPLPEYSNRPATLEGRESIPRGITFGGTSYKSIDEELNSSFSSEEGTPQGHHHDQVHPSEGGFSDRQGSNAHGASSILLPSTNIPPNRTGTSRAFTESGYSKDILRVRRGDAMTRDSDGFSALAHERMSRANDNISRQSLGTENVEYFSPRYDNTGDNQLSRAKRPASSGRGSFNHTHFQDINPSNQDYTDVPSSEAKETVYEVYPGNHSQRTTRLQNLRSSIGLKQGYQISRNENNTSNQLHYTDPRSYQPFRDYNGPGNDSFPEPSYNCPAQEIGQVQRHTMRSSRPPAYNEEMYGNIGEATVVPGKQQSYNAKVNAPVRIMAGGRGRSLRGRQTVDNLQFIERGGRKCVTFDRAKNLSDGDVDTRGRGADDFEHSSESSGEETHDEKRYDDGYASTTGRLSESDAGGRSRDPQSLHAYSERASLRYAGRQNRVPGGRIVLNGGAPKDVSRSWRDARVHAEEQAWSTDEEGQEQREGGGSYRNKRDSVGSRRGGRFEDRQVRNNGGDIEQKKFIRRGDFFRKLRRDVKGSSSTNNDVRRASANVSDTNSEVEEPRRNTRSFKGILKKTPGKTAPSEPLPSTRHPRSRYMTRFRPQ